MCTLFYACNWDQASSLLGGFATFAFVTVVIVGLVRIGIEYERAKRAGVDLDAIVKDARRHAPRSGKGADGS